MDRWCYMYLGVFLSLLGVLSFPYFPLARDEKRIEKYHNDTIEGEEWDGQLNEMKDTQLMVFLFELVGVELVGCVWCGCGVGVGVGIYVGDQVCMQGMM